jgi:hypothetical protein
MSMTAHLFNTSVGLRVSVDHPDHHEFIFSLTLLLTIKRTNKQNKQPNRKLPISFHTITKMKFSTIAITAFACMCFHRSRGYSLPAYWRCPQQRRLCRTALSSSRTGLPCQMR